MISNRIIEFKAKNEIMNMFTKEYGELNTFMSIMRMTKITVDM